ncbi:hypothetical protein L6164_004002 [Bauhinia variegata]|uniref:Uncharacterized protein n=1 Tax=Bauhinia variegata TaxID=167791 RepID=A0ACB9Q310_BAUVA|nr:hypothetical protein L6164_004002 [Bauhinia variegata]
MGEVNVQVFKDAPYSEDQPTYVPSELVNFPSNSGQTLYYCYLIELKQNFRNDVQVHDLVLAMRSELDPEIGSTQFEMTVGDGSMMVNLRYLQTIHLHPDEVHLCKKFQITLFWTLLRRDMSGLAAVFDDLSAGDSPGIDYLVLPSAAAHERPSIIDWATVKSVSFSSEGSCECGDLAHGLFTKNGRVCTCKLKNSLICTPHNIANPHNGYFYVTTDITELNGNSLLSRRRKRAKTYKKYFEDSHSIRLRYEHQPLLKAKHHFQVKNYLLKGRQETTKGSSQSSVELPPELCEIIMSPISINTIYSFSFIPSIMHRIESLLIAFNLKKMHLDHCTQNDIPTSKILEAITALECQESIDYESLETLGDSFLKYAVSQQLFKTYQTDREGHLTDKRIKITSNVALCKVGCSRKLPGFIRKGTFDPKTWIIPGNKSSFCLQRELVSSGTKVYRRGSRKLGYDIVADVVESLIGVFLIEKGEEAALLFMNWIGIEVDFDPIPYKTNLNIHPEEFVNVNLLKSLLNNYSFNDASLLVEALTHGSFIRPEIPRSYQRLEFLGDSLLDYLITIHFYNKYSDIISPGMLTDMREASVNNEHYALCIIKSGLYKYLLASEVVRNNISVTLNNFHKLSSESNSGCESETGFTKVLSDVIESLAGAILVDSGYKKTRVFDSIIPLLQPLVTPETVKLQPIRELNELCAQNGWKWQIEKVEYCHSGETCVTIEVETNGISHKYTAKARKKRIAERLASRKALESLKKTISKG